jgi:hypothetical protein
MSAPGSGSPTRDDVFARQAFLRRAAAERVFGFRHKIAGARDPKPRPIRPIFVVGCPRSGTSVLFAMLSEHERLRSFPGEGHRLWNAYQHPRRKGWTSDRASAEDVRTGEAEFLYAAIAHTAGSDRFLDKTPKNVMRMSYLATIFPDALFVLLRRDGRATVSSLIEGWRARRGISYRLPEPLHLADYRGRYWSYILPPRWRALRDSSIPEVAAMQYVASNEIAIADSVDISDEAVVPVTYEDLTRDPAYEARRILERLELPASDAVLGFARDLAARHVGSISAPSSEKWRRRQSEIERVGELFRPTSERLGYTWDRSTH